VGIAVSVTVLLLSAAFGGTIWRYEHAQVQGRAALANRGDRMRDQRAVAVFWHEREAINEFLITRAPHALKEIVTLRAEFFRLTAPEIQIEGDSPELRAARRANTRLLKEFALRAKESQNVEAGRQAVAALHPYEDAVLAPLRTMDLREGLTERGQTTAAAEASREARVVAIVGVFLAIAAGLGFVVYVSGLLRRVLRQSGELERTLEEREETHAALHDRDRQLRQAQKMEAVGRLAGGVAHDFNNMLLAITGYGALALTEIEPAQSSVRHALEQIELAAGRAAALTAQLLAFSRQQVIQPQAVDINGLVNGLTAMLRPMLGATIELHVELGPSAGAVSADPGQLEQVITNLVVNARDAMPAGGRITIAAAKAGAADVPTSLPPGEYAAILVTDTGEGMDEETQSRALDPFFTTKEQGKGTGLGLATVHGIVAQSHGDIRIESAPGAGTTIAIYLPMTLELPARVATEVIGPRGGTETVLLVEDDQVVQSLLLDVLVRNNYEVVAASDGAQALAAAARTDVPPDLLLTDMVMPGVGGRELANELQTLYPEMRAIYMSGYSQDASLYESAASGQITFLQKPFTPDDILRTIREVLDPVA
jgi:signal transduction histidine kinase